MNRAGMIKQGEHHYNQIKMGAGSTTSSSVEKSPYLKEPPKSSVQSQEQMASSQPAYSEGQGENVEHSPPPEKSLENQTPMITLTLLHPQQSVAVQTWRFEPQSSIKIGRSRNNEVTLYSAVVSRHHVEIRRQGKEWEIISLGSNGTFCEGKRIRRTPVKNGMIIRLASSGPQIQIWMDMLTDEKKQSLGKSSQEAVSQQDKHQAEARAKQSRSTKLSPEELEKAKETQMD